MEQRIGGLESRAKRKHQVLSELMQEQIDSKIEGLGKVEEGIILDNQPQLAAKDFKESLQGRC
jgi:hypothetical protein